MMIRLMRNKIYIIAQRSADKILCNDWIQVERKTWNDRYSDNK